MWWSVKKIEHLCGGEAVPSQAVSVLFFSWNGSDTYLNRADSRMSYCYQKAAALGSELSPMCRGTTKPTERPGFPVCSHARMFQAIRGPSCQQQLVEVWEQAYQDLRRSLGEGVWDRVQPSSGPFLLWSVGMYLASYFKVPCLPDPWIQNLRPQIISMKHFLETLS